jgi:GT2 family glycosyltransferase
MSEHRANIPPVPQGERRPQWSVLIPTFNCADFLGETLESVLAQDPGPELMEIIVVDDCSTSDDPEAVVKRIAPARARFIRQPRNVGKVRNYETGLLASRGYLIHQLHGDDRVLPGFYESIGLGFEAWPAAGAFFCESNYIDEHGAVTGRTGRPRDDVGILDGFLKELAVAQRIQTPSMVVRREVYETLGGFDRRLSAVEDWEMWIRVASQFAVGFVPETLAEYRVWASNNTRRTILSGKRSGQLRAAIGIVDEYLPPALIAEIKKDRDQAMAQYMLQFIPLLMSQHLYARAGIVGLKTLTFSRDLRTCYRLLKYSFSYRKYLPQ